MPDPATFTNTDDLIEAMRRAGWFCMVRIRTDEQIRERRAVSGYPSSRYQVWFYRESGRWETGQSAGAPTLRKAAFNAATRACKAAALAALVPE